MSETRRYLGLELAGAKNQKTAVSTLEFYPKEKKIFLLDIFDRIGANDLTGDETLLELIQELIEGSSKKSVRMGVNVPLTLPACIGCTKKTCPMPENCTVPSVKWMRTFLKKMGKKAEEDPLFPKILEFTPYTQRPIELWARYQVLPTQPESHRFEIDEALGGNKAPLTARIHFLQRHLKKVTLIEAWPKLTLALLSKELDLTPRMIQSWRKLEEGIQAREEILEALIQKKNVFIYERDIRKLSQNLPAFDSLLCAYTALLSDQNQCTKAPAQFPVNSGWVEYPHA